MRRDVGQNAGERANTKFRVAWNRYVMFATFVSGQAHMAARLTGDLISDAPEDSDEIIATQSARQSHTVMTSSRTK
jgi:hypothetical protein